MNENTKKLIEKAKPYKVGTEITSMYVIPSERPYQGPWTPNDYEHMILIGVDDDAESGEAFYLISHEDEGSDIDVLMFFLSKVHSIDVPQAFSAVRLVFATPVVIDECLSSITPRAVKDELEDVPVAID